MTRTLHFGTPTEDQRIAYTLVLKGHIDLARITIPTTVKDTRIDALARAPLYNKGLDFLPGTGHGIGAFLSVHESKHFTSYTLLDLEHMIIIICRSNLRRNWWFAREQI